MVTGASAVTVFHLPLWPALISVILGNLVGAVFMAFKTIADFRADNRAAFKPVFRQFVLLCRKLDLLAASFGGGWHADQGG